MDRGSSLYIMGAAPRLCVLTCPSMFNLVDMIDSSATADTQYGAAVLYRYGHDLELAAVSSL